MGGPFQFRADITINGIHMAATDWITIRFKQIAILTPTGTQANPAKFPVGIPRVC